MDDYWSERWRVGHTLGVVDVVQLGRLHERLVTLETALGGIAGLAEGRLGEVGEVPLGAEGRDVAFRYCEILCGAMQFIRQYAHEAIGEHKEELETVKLDENVRLAPHDVSMAAARLGEVANTLERTGFAELAHRCRDILEQMDGLETEISDAVWTKASHE